MRTDSLSVVPGGPNLEIHYLMMRKREKQLMDVVQQILQCFGQSSSCTHCYLVTRGSALPLLGSSLHTDRMNQSAIEKRNFLKHRHVLPKIKENNSNLSTSFGASELYETGEKCSVCFVRTQGYNKYSENIEKLASQFLSVTSANS